MIRMTVRGDDATTIDAIVMETVVVGEAARVVAMSTSLETQVRRATVEELMSTAPIVNA